jgi:hypothetical protein
MKDASAFSHHHHQSPNIIICKKSSSQHVQFYDRTTTVLFSSSSSTEDDSPLVTAKEGDTIELISASEAKSNTSNNALKRWERRLNTFEDAFSIHKLSAIVYTITSFTLMGTAATRWLIGGQEMFATIPGYVEPIMWSFCISNLFMCAASIRMAILYRNKNVASRNAFIGVAGSSLFSGYFLIWASPFAPEQMITPLASKIGFGILCGWNLILILDTMIRAGNIIDDRRDNTSEEENGSFWVEYLRYIASAAWPLPVILSTGYIDAVLYDHTFLINVFDQVWNSEQFGLQSSVFYNNVGGSMAASYAAFFITLRDKMLISKKVEWIGILVFSVPILIWTVDVSARIFPYVLGTVELVQ